MTTRKNLEDTITKQKQDLKQVYENHSSLSAQVVDSYIVQGGSLLSSIAVLIFIILAADEEITRIGTDVTNEHRENDAWNPTNQKHVWSIQNGGPLSKEVLCQREVKKEKYLAYINNVPMSIGMPGMLYKCLRIPIIKHGIRCNHFLQRQPYFYNHPPPSATEKTYTFRKWIPCSDKKTIVVNENQLSKHKTARVINPRKKNRCYLYHVYNIP